MASALSLGMDARLPPQRLVWRRLTFYSGDVTKSCRAPARTNTEWYMLTGYTDWRGKHVFLDTQLSAAYGNFDGNPRPCRRRQVRTATSQARRRDAGAGRQHRPDSQLSAVSRSTRISAWTA